MSFIKLIIIIKDICIKNASQILEDDTSLKTINIIRVQRIKSQKGLARWT